jgi:hypothetical protein
VIRGRSRAGALASTWWWEAKSDVATWIAAAPTDGGATQSAARAERAEARVLRKESVSGMYVGDVGDVGGHGQCRRGGTVEVGELGHRWA